MSHSESANLAGSVPAIDLMSLLGRCLGNFKMVERVLAAFRDTGLSDLNQLQEALEDSNFQEVTEISHRFKGSAGNVSAKGLHELLTKAEQLGREQNSIELTKVLEQLQSEWMAFERYAQVFAPRATLRSHVPQHSLETLHASAGCGR